ncbi:heptaprenyl diphosphate synthase component 1 [Paenibacillus arenilitoris]|uniref:Heptaprenyl diphosphate synthase component 1 n=1 Tax=Paenibacillus arenilitoris TaxID=2772299 RepID=A0A927CLZ3_9BACL|nr:heptaprenyl diphosphate synthase component 1 [Paenibacillus arenilitoris]MBD2869652.1 heptaprenyl diphosphate synthase component 1 [Paenibacillus arenilitoris]
MKPYRISEIAQKYVEYDMIQSHTELPAMSSPRLRALYAFLNQQQSVAKHSELYTLVISLVQLGMDTHDLIDTDETKRPEPEMRARQLNVLAGDYFSARFYHLLSQAGQIDMVSKISGAVCEVNRLKVNLYMRMRQLKISAEDYLTQSVQLRSTLFQLFTGVLEGNPARLWSEVVGGISRCEVVLDEIERSESPVRFDKSWAYWHVLQEGTEEERQTLAERSGETAFIAGLVDKYEVRRLLAAKLKQSVEAFKAAAGRLESDKLLGELNQIVDGLLNGNGNSGYAPALNKTR